ncbi:hypothetical protein SISNIDRAFT_550367 [Sistotremastrum niveocremeum HHB9708]|uniref:Uncharacterized protein n=2 Tax=Sistotremastraceae TaxID=3402574 RepID=A0A164TFU2_9AGAM|nr:hypothetical protein SISNIDRAFT_550367 [Sistotremastrum niveocremeum HHB9708]KZT41241.1 hypothetical protein SISSUDRAFT_1126613 [Sistotremastrum suecicum HHB10207 ss-3]
MYRIAVQHAPRRLTAALYSSTVHENDPETLEREKARNLAKEQHHTSTPHEHAPGWNEYLASSSEAHVKADKSEGTAEELQTRTVEHIKKRHHEDNDNVKGPLSSAVGKSD